ncbi:MAG: hypothetical protein SGILL_004009 [Bacillariaceae sp.]
MNDWSARDIQKWEYVPLGPFTSKNFATSISPWIVTSEALEAYKVPTSASKQDDPVPLDYLQDPDYSSYDIQLSVSIQSESMSEGHVVCQSNFANLYWNAAQQLVHHSVTGCMMRTGDLLGSGTISGTPENSFGSMLELSWKGSRKVSLGHADCDENRKFLQDGDTVVMKGFCSKPGHGRVGFGECRGKVHPCGKDIEVMGVKDAVDARTYKDFKLVCGDTSSASSCTIRIALAAKKVPYTTVPPDSSSNTVHLPLLQYTDSTTGRCHTISGSLAIIKFLDCIFPKSRALVPRNSQEEQVAIQMIETIILEPGSTDTVHRSLTRLEELVEERKRLGYGGPYAMGGFSPNVVDCFLVPHLHSSRRQNIAVEEEFPKLNAIVVLCCKKSIFSSAKQH